MSYLRPLTFFFVSFRNHRCPFWNHCFNKQQIMRRRLQNKRASQLRTPEDNAKNPYEERGPNDQSLTRFANAASLFSLHSICRGFQIPAAIPNTIDMISNFSNSPLSITSRQAMHRYLCAIQQEGKPECSIAAKQRTLGSKRKAHRICPSTSRTPRPCLHAPAARQHPDSPSIPTRKDGVNNTDLRIEQRTSHSAKRDRRNQKDTV